MYCTLEDLVNRFSLVELIQLTDESGSGIIDDQVVNGAIEDASDYIDGLISSRYALPLVDVPNILKQHCAHLARYNLYDNTVPEVVEKNHKMAVDYLMKVGEGKLKLGPDAEGDEPTTEDVIEMESAGSVFARSNSGGFI